MDVENRHCARLSVATAVLGMGAGAGTGEVLIAGRGVALVSGETDTGGGVPVFRQRHQHARSGAQETWVLTLASDALSASECFRALLAGGGLSSSGSLVVLLG